MTVTTPVSMPTARMPSTGGVFVRASEDLAWRTSPRGTLREKAVRRDDASGSYLGLVAFEPMTSTGLHQHLGTASSLFLSGSLTDYHGTASAGELGINLAGATHDAFSYPGCMLVSRLEGPVAIPADGLAAHPHAEPGILTDGVGSGMLRNPHPDRPPDITVRPAEVRSVATPFAGIRRQPLFDYRPTGDRRRLLTLSLRPHLAPVPIEHRGLTDFFVLAGDLRIGSHVVTASGFAVIEPGATVSIGSDHGCLLLVWAEDEGRCAATGAAELYGFG